MCRSITFRYIFLTVVLVAVFLVWSATPSQAVVYGDSGSAPSSPQGIGSGGGGAIPTLYNINFSNAEIPWSRYAGLLSNASILAGANSSNPTTRNNTDLAVSNQIDGRGKSACTPPGGNYDTAAALAAGCVLWQNYIVPSSSEWGYQVHLPSWGNNAIVGWNIKIWRQGTPQPIFQRSVCDPTATDHLGHNTDPYRGVNWNTEWWDCGSEGPYAENTADAGMLGSPSGNESQQPQCVDNAAGGQNGARTAQVGPNPNQIVPDAFDASSGTVTEGGIRPTWKSGQAPPPGTWCYWEGTSQMGEYSYGSPYYPNNGKSQDYNTQLESKHPALRNQFNNGAGSCTGSVCSGGLYQAGLKEAIYLKWSIPTPSSGNHNASFQYAIEGAPGVWYAVQIVALNWKQQMMPIFQGNQFAVSASGGSCGTLCSPQYFRAFIANPTITPPACPTCVSSSFTSAPQPSPTVHLYATSPLQVRQTGQQVVTLSIDGNPLAPSQAVFPIDSYLVHFTPQASYDGAEGSGGCVASGAYGANYVNYDSDLSPPLETFITGGPTPQPGHPGQSACVVYLPQAAQLTDDARSIGPQSQNTYNTTWLEPTLTNPCTSSYKTVGNSDFSLTATWPQSLSECTASGAPPPKGSVTPTTASCPATPTNPSGVCPTVLNAWDDEMIAEETWEAVWASSIGSPPTYGYITNQLLRCNSLAAIFVTSSGNNCSGAYASPWYGLSPISHAPNDAQYAQGYINVYKQVPSSYKGTEQAAAEVKLQTNGPLGQMALWNRTTGQVFGNPIFISTAAGAEQSNTLQDQQHITNSRESDNELNFCSQGAPAGTHIYYYKIKSNKDAPINNYASSNPNNYSATATGDAACQGYAVHWVWSDPTSLVNPDCNVNFSSKPSGDAGALPASAFPPPTAVMFNPTTHELDTAQTNILASWGLYGEEEPGSEVAYNTSTWFTDSLAQELFGGDPKTPPYTGQRPGTYPGGTASTENIEHCSQVYPLPNSGAVAHWKVGHWTRSWVFTPLPVDSNHSGNCRFKVTTDQLSNSTTYNGLSYPESLQPVGINVPAGTPTDCPPPVNYTHKDVPLPVNPLSSLPSNSSGPYNTPNWVQVASYTSSPSKGCPSPAYDLSANYFTTCTPNYVPIYSKGVIVGQKLVNYSVVRYVYMSPYQDNYYTFGYWHWQYQWVWGSTAPGAAWNDCSTSITSLKQTNFYHSFPSEGVAQAPKEQFAGALENPGKYGRTKFVYGYGAPTPDPAQPAGNDTEYDGVHDATYLGATYTYGQLWVGTQYTDSSQAGVPDAQGVSGGNVWGSISMTGANSWDCVVVRHGGWDTNGAWSAGDPNNEFNAQYGAIPSSVTEDSQTFTPVFAGPGWGANNTGPRIPNGEYTAQFAFPSPGFPQQLAQPSAYCQARELPFSPAAAFTSPPSEYCWELSASYDGQTNLTWEHTVTFNRDAFRNDLSTAIVQVYGPRNIR